MELFEVDHGLLDTCVLNQLPSEAVFTQCPGALLGQETPEQKRGRGALKLQRYAAFSSTATHGFIISCDPIMK